MILEIDDEIAKKCPIDESEALELLAVAIYKTKGIDATLAGQILGMSEIEFHRLLKKPSKPSNFGIDSLVADVKQHLAQAKNEN